jgi:hypothetical protein
MYMSASPRQPYSSLGLPRSGCLGWHQPWATRPGSLRARSGRLGGCSVRPLTRCRSWDALLDHCLRSSLADAVLRLCTREFPPSAGTGGWRATRGCGCAVVASGRGRRALCGAAPPSVKPAARPDPSGTSTHQPFGSHRHRGRRVTSGGAGRIGSGTDAPMDVKQLTAAFRVGM